MKILLIEDNPRMLLAMTIFLERQNFCVDAISCGQIGLSKALENGHDVMIMDTVIYGKNGFEIIEEVRLANIKMPILVLSAMADPRDRDIIHSLGADHFLEKSLDAPEWMQVIRNFAVRNSTFV